MQLFEIDEHFLQEISQLRQVQLAIFPNKLAGHYSIQILEYRKLPVQDVQFDFDILHVEQEGSQFWQSKYKFKNWVNKQVGINLQRPGKVDEFEISKEKLEEHEEQL